MGVMLSPRRHALDDLAFMQVGCLSGARERLTPERVGALGH